MFKLLTSVHEVPSNNSVLFNVGGFAVPPKQAAAVVIPTALLSKRAVFKSPISVQEEPSYCSTFAMVGGSTLLNGNPSGKYILFVGLGKTFQIWEPKLFDRFKISARKKAFKNRSSLKWENKSKKEEV